METLNEQETRAFLEMAQTIERQQKEIEQLRILVDQLETQLYGSR